MFRIRSDKATNRLYIRLSGSITLAEANDAVQRIDSEASILKAGFDVINDFSLYRAGDQRAEPMVSQVMNLLANRGVGRVVRIVGNSKEGLKQFARVSTGVDGYSVKYVPTMADAEEFLSKGA